MIRIKRGLDLPITGAPEQRIQAGRPVPGFMRVSKRALADMTNRARKTAGPKALARATETARRIAAAGSLRS